MIRDLFTLVGGVAIGHKLTKWRDKLRKIPRVRKAGGPGAGNETPAPPQTKLQVTVRKIYISAVLVLLAAFGVVYHALHYGFVCFGDGVAFDLSAFSVAVALVYLLLVYLALSAVVGVWKIGAAGAGPVDAAAQRAAEQEAARRAAEEEAVRRKEQEAQREAREKEEKKVQKAIRNKEKEVRKTTRTGVGWSIPFLGKKNLQKLTAQADDGNAEAQYALGWMHAEGEGVPQDGSLAVKWWHRAAEQGHKHAQYFLGNKYNRGDGVAEDDAKAAEWWLLAAEQGVAGAQYNLGLVHAVGEGVAQDDVRAYKWFNLAAAQGDEDAKSGKDDAAKRMTDEQLAEAQKLAGEFEVRLE